MSEETEREDVKNYFSDYATVAWVDFDKGDQEVSRDNIELSVNYFREAFETSCLVKFKAWNQFF